MRRLISPTSSMKRVPPCASSSKPGVALRAREAAAHVPEQLRLEQRLRHAGAIDRDERAWSAGWLPVDQMRHDFLADAALSSDQDFGVGARCVPDVLEHTADSHTCTDQLLVPVLVHMTRLRDEKLRLS